MPAATLEQRVTDTAREISGDRGLDVLCGPGLARFITNGTNGVPQVQIDPSKAFNADGTPSHTLLALAGTHGSNRSTDEKVSRAAASRAARLAEMERIKANLLP